MRKIDIHLHAVPDDPNMDAYVAMMDQYEVDAGLVHGLPSGGRKNEDILRAVKAHPGRLFGSVYIDLLKPVDECIEETRRYASEGFKSVKLFPNYGYDPNEEKYEPFWEVVEELGLLCLSHCGWLAHRPENAQVYKCSLTATPFHFEVPARRHAGIQFIFAHFGGGASYLETVTLISRLPNCHADTCPGWGRWVWAQNMPGIQDLDFTHVLYGTDNKRGDGYATDESWWVQCLSKMGYTQTDIENYFYGNSARLLGLED